MSDFKNLEYGVCDRCGRGVTSSVVDGKIEHNFVVRLQGYNGNRHSPQGVFCDDCDHLNQIREFVAEQILQGSFGDGLEQDYVRGGTEITGAYQMSDYDVVYEFLAMFEGEDVDDDAGFAQLLLWAITYEETHRPARVREPQHMEWSVEMTHGTDITTTHTLAGTDLASLGVMLKLELEGLQVLVNGGAYAPLTKLTITLLNEEVDA